MRGGDGKKEKRESKKSTEREEEKKEKRGGEGEGGWSKRETLSACQEFSIVNELLIWLSRKLFQEVWQPALSNSPPAREMEYNGLISPVLIWRNLNNL